MEARCVAPDCGQRAAATIRQQTPVCVDHYWQSRHRLEKRGLRLAEFKGSMADLLQPEHKWRPLALALADEATVLRHTARQLREAASEAVDELKTKRPPRRPG